MRVGGRDKVAFFFSFFLGRVAWRGVGHLHRKWVGTGIGYCTFNFKIFTFAMNRDAEVSA